jgi:hydroxyacylglutathione hydrolase
MTSPSSGQSGDPFRPILADEFLSQAQEGVDVLDVRGGPAYALSHLRGSIFVGLSPMFPNWVQALLDASRPIQVIADPGQERSALACLVELGHGEVRGYLEGGFDSIADRTEYLATTERVDCDGLAGELDSEDPPYLIDVRQPHEWQQGRIGNAPNLPLTEFANRTSEVPGDRRVILQCMGGYRSLIAASFLERAGHMSTIDMAGGFGAWAEAGLPVQPAG